MSELGGFQRLLEEIDRLLEAYDPGSLEPDRVLGDILDERAAQRPLLESVVQLATEGLTRYPFNAELLRRRALARSLIVTPELTYPEIESAEEDLRAILAVEPDNLHAAFELLEAMFTFSGMEDKEVADLAETCASKAEAILLQFASLQIKALAYAGEHSAAEAVFHRWIHRFPQSDALRTAKEDADSMKSE